MRVRCKPGEQRAFMERVYERTELSRQLLGEVCGVGRHVLQSWWNEECNARLEILEKLSELTGVSLPEFEEVITEDEMRRRRAQAAFATRQREGNPLGTHETRVLGGKTSSRLRQEQPELYEHLEICRIVKKPEYSPELAEFVGIMLGDGGLTKNQVRVSLNPHEEYDYAVYIADLMERLFGYRPSIQSLVALSELSVTLSSVDAVRFLQSIGLVIGSKVRQQADIPDWIFTNIEFVRACIRGMMDTDGCVYHHTYNLNGKDYTYLMMTFTSHSKPMLQGMQQMLLMLGLHPTAEHKEHVTLYRNDEAILYHERLVGTSNPYHVRRYQAALEERKKRRT